MLPRVAFEYGHTLCASRTSSTAGVALDRGQRYVELHASRRCGPRPGLQRDLGVDRDVAGLSLLPARDGAERALEAGRVADREELLGVGAAAFAAHLGRQPQVDLERPVAGLAVPLGAASGDVRLGGVDDFAHRVLQSKLVWERPYAGRLTGWRGG